MLKAFAIAMRMSSYPQVQALMKNKASGGNRRKSSIRPAVASCCQHQISRACMIYNSKNKLPWEVRYYLEEGKPYRGILY